VHPDALATRDPEHHQLGVQRADRFLQRFERGFRAEERDPPSSSREYDPEHDQAELVRFAGRTR
jgi:hypothetical protein